MKDDDEVTFRIVPLLGVRDAARAERLEKFVNWQWRRPFTDETNVLQMFAFMWTLIGLRERMRRFWLYGNNPPN